MLTPELTQQIAELVREGHYVETIANALHIGKATFYRWLERGQTDTDNGDYDGPYARFRDAVKGSEGWAEIDNTREWKNAGAFWAKHATFNERRWPERWRKRDDSENQPRVVIQVGVRDGDVALALSPTFTKAISESTQKR